MKNPFAPIVMVPGSPEWKVVHEAMAQFVENHRDYIDGQDEANEADVAKQAVAEAIMERFDSVYVAVAEI